MTVAGTLMGWWEKENCVYAETMHKAPPYLLKNSPQRQSERISETVAPRLTVRAGGLATSGVHGPGSVFAHAAERMDAPLTGVAATLPCRTEVGGHTLTGWWECESALGIAVKSPQERGLEANSPTACCNAQ